MAIPDVTKATIATVLDRVPDLTREGFGRPSYVPRDEWPAFRRASRERLLDSAREIEDLALILSGARPSHDYLSSYDLKQRLERRFDALGVGRHVSNGACVVAAHLCGFSHRPATGVNVLINIDQRFLSGPTTGLPYCVSFDENDLREIDRLTARLNRHDPSRHGLPVTQIATGSEQLDELDATLSRLQGVVGMQGKLLKCRLFNRSRRWICRDVIDSRPLQTAVLLALRSLSEEMAQAIAGLTSLSSNLTPDELAQPASEEFRRVVTDVTRTLADVAATVAT